MTTPLPLPPEEERDLKSLQPWLAQCLEGLEHPPLGMGVALAEECGECARHLLDHHAYGKPLDSDALGSELADVLICLCEMATHHGIDLEEAVWQRCLKLSGQAVAWRKTLGEALKAAREEPPRP